MKIHETYDDHGKIEATHLVIEDDVLGISINDDRLALPDNAIEVVMRRYGAPLDPEQKITEVSRLDLGTGRAIRHVRHLAYYDVIARDYLVYDTDANEPICALATTVAAALIHLGRVSSSST